MVYRVPAFFPTSGHSNHGVVVVAPGSDKPFSVFAVGLLPDLSMWGSGPSQYFARYRFEALDSADAQGAFDLSGGDAVVVDGYKRIDNITDHTLTQYRDWYGTEVTKDDIFAFIYGFLHSPDYRERFAADLKRSLPRIPRIERDDFAPFRDAGQGLLELHIGYEDLDPYPLTVVGGEPVGDPYDWFRVEKLRWGTTSKARDRSTIVYNTRITVAGIPEAAHGYMLGSRSALEWILDRYQVKTDKPSGIVNDPNDYAREVGSPRYILDLIAKVTTVSVRTVAIVEGLPSLRIVDGE